MKYFVHRFDVIRIKVAVEAETQLEAIKKAGEFIDADYPIKPYFPASWPDTDENFAETNGYPAHLGHEPACETIEYFVDEVGDEGFEHSKTYKVENLT